MNKLPSKLMIITYRAGTSGDVLAEYADDKIRFSEKFGIKTYVITSLGGILTNNSYLKIFYVPSISLKDFNLELEQLRLNQLTQPAWIKLYKIIPNSIGRFIDAFYRLFNGELGYARWSWTINVFFVGVYVKWFHSVKHCLAIGSASSYLAGLILKKTVRIDLYIEVPDPIIGSEMMRSNLKANLFRIFEKELIQNSIKYFLITKRSYLDSVNRHPKLKNKICFHYPEAWNFNIRIEQTKRDQIQIAHLGSIYDNRNLDNWFSALDGLYEKKLLTLGDIRILNIGMSKCKNSNNYLQRADYKLMAGLPRSEALQIAANSDYLFLLQHTDSRSSETIPYKLYDYLNLRIPIIALINNPEISDMLSFDSQSLTADVNDIASIQELILHIQPSNSRDSLRSKENTNFLEVGQSFSSIFL
jgi:hypothetical protein